ncbi:right-handed parallel beta-helix repeat-containing protein [Cellulophaga baltica]|uniref:right-handed parallel beta-helix repeat-containing protein n=1 Tax=Cellulophaga TaxID=104264 RepID=UPI001C07E372|nr:MULTISPECIES: right-handed parallel beta-helix repeat-containing protein [Cellulophaga]MBU2997915.1 right-handed parallel beta-helix repeat-containing protein [Cellulophaga baltica]MDO6769316.1 right-handed parallel beta-helix repeat-containing protein [Cellulophaga sp. 1_MG-2023]
MKKSFLFLFLCLCFSISFAKTTTFYVATNGSDTNPGTKKLPFATLIKARNTVRNIKKQKNDITIYIRGGRYYLKETIVFNETDSGKNDHKIIYKAYPGEKPVFIGGKPLYNWEKVGAGLYKTKIDIPDDEFYHIYENGKRAFEARYPNEGYLLGIKKEVENTALDFSINPVDIQDNFTFTQRSRIYLWAGNDWFSAFVPMKSVDKSKGIIKLRDTLHLTDVNKRSPRRYYLTGIKEALDAPSEFYYNTDTKELFYYPISKDINKSEIVIPLITSIIRFVGKQEPVKNIEFSGIDFSITRFGAYFTETKNGTHGTNGWNEPANKEGLIYFENANNCIINKSIISNAGYNGVSMVWDAQENTVKNSEIKNCGFHGVLLSGYRATFGSKADFNKKHNITNNHIHHCGKLIGHSAGIFIWASGKNKITHNEIHDMPRYGICIKGQRWGGKFGAESNIKINTGEVVTKDNKWDFVHSRENYIAYNDIYSVSKDSEDNGMISFWGSGKNNVVYNNKLHDITDKNVEGITMAVYLDDAADYTTVENNLIFNINAGAKIYPILAKGVHNSIINNYIICEASNKAAVRNVTQYSEEVKGHIYKKNIIYLKGDADIFSIGTWNDEKFVESDYNLIFSEKGNYTYSVENKKLSVGDWKKEFNGRYATHNVYENPEFYNVNTNDFRLKKDSPAFKMGIKEIELNKFGIQPIK